MEPTNIMFQTNKQSNSKKEELPNAQESFAKKESILVTDESDLERYKRKDSKVTFQWKEGVEEKLVEDVSKIYKRIGDYPLGHLVTRGSRWIYIRDYINNISRRKSSESTVKLSDEQMQEMFQRKRSSLLELLWLEVERKRKYGKGLKLNTDQETKLEILKHRVKTDNNFYLKQHPELDTLLLLVFRALFKNKPDNPKLFVANYIHYLNTHREEFVVEDTDVPFDRPPPPTPEPSVKLLSVDEEREYVQLIAKQIVEKCVKIASRGITHVNVTSIMDSILHTAVPSQDDMSRGSVEVVVSEILLSLLTSVAVARTTCTELVVEEILDAVLQNILPKVEKDSEISLEIRESVEQFVQSLLKTITEGVANSAELKENDSQSNSKTLIVDYQSLHSDQSLL